MNIAISNIAWDPQEDQEILDLMHRYHIRGLEVAPKKVWPSPETVSDTLLQNYRTVWKKQGFQIVATQAILYDHPELTIFQNETTRQQTFDYIAKMIILSAKLGASAIVFGSPKNRHIGDIKPSQALDIAISFFRSLGEIANKNNTHLCIEPNPPDYGCNFICNTQEGIDLVKRVDHPGFRLHLDAGALTLNGESYEQAITDAFPLMQHFHISEPWLGLTGMSNADHSTIAKTLRTLGYQHWVSIEMKNNLMKPNTRSVQQSLDFVSRMYS